MSLEIKDVAKAYQQADNRLQILNHLNLAVERGQILAVVGESGSGKSTLLSILAGLDRPDTGEIAWDGQATSRWSDEDWAHFRKRHLGFVFQSYYLIPYLTAAENAALPSRLNGEDSGESLRLLKELGLGGRLDHLPGQMSGGECQRVAIARALAHRPKLVLADEPTGSLDLKTGQQVLDLLFGLLRERSQTAVIVTHSQDVAQRCDRVFALREGRLWPV